MINFNEPVYLEKSMEYIKKAILINKRLNGDGEFCGLCADWLEKKFHAPKIMLTTSCTHGLEMASLLCDIQPGDEVIMPSYTFVSTADAFVLRGARVKFVDIDPKTMNINANLIEYAITERTKVIVPVHYAGVGCDMDTIIDIAKRHNLLVVEDAAQAMMATYKGQYLGSIWALLAILVLTAFMKPKTTPWVKVARSISIILPILNAVKSFAKREPTVPNSSAEKLINIPG